MTTSEKEINEHKASGGPFAAPSARGWITTAYQTYKGKKLGPYHVRVWFENGKRKKQYIKKQDLEKVRAACQAYREDKLKGRAIARNLANILGNLNWLEKKANRMDRGIPLTEEDVQFIHRLDAEGINTPGRTPLRRHDSVIDWSLTTDEAIYLLAELAMEMDSDSLFANFQAANLQGTGGPWMARTGAPLVSVKPRGKHIEAMDGGDSEGVRKQKQEATQANGIKPFTRFLTNPPSALPAPRKRRNFMDQFFTKFLKHIENEASSIEQEVFGIETSEEKWARWRKIIASRPKPRPLPTVETPSWLDHAEVHAAAEHCLELRKMQGSSQPPAPDGPPAEAKDSKGKEKASEDRITAQAEDLRRHFRIQEDKSQ